MNVFNILGSYDDAWKAIVMPPRQDYSIYDLGIPLLHFQNLTFDL